MKYILLLVALAINSHAQAFDLSLNGGIRTSLAGNYQFEVDPWTGTVKIGEGEAILGPGSLHLEFHGPMGIEIFDTTHPENIPVFKADGLGNLWLKGGMNVNNVFAVDSKCSLTVAQKLVNNTNTPTAADVGEGNGWLQVSNGVLYYYAVTGKGAVKATKLSK